MSWKIKREDEKNGLEYFIDKESNDPICVVIKDESKVFAISLCETDERADEGVIFEKDKADQYVVGLYNAYIIPVPIQKFKKEKYCFLNLKRLERIKQLTRLVPKAKKSIEICANQLYLE